MEQNTVKDQRGRRNIVKGQVVSDKGDKTISVLIYRLMKHPKYKKYIRKKSVFKAHDEENQAKKGDVVKIYETRPLSKTKRWKLLEIMESTDQEETSIKRGKMKWTKLHELKVLLIYKKVKENGEHEDELCEKLKSTDESFTCSLDSIKMKLQNIHFLDTGEGLPNLSQLNQEIFKKYKNYSIERLKDEIEQLEN